MQSCNPASVQSVSLGNMRGLIHADLYGDLANRRR
jgi:hypothetical protein